ncbi:MAG: hypothetical protein K5840_07365, partial [Eubacterium sp.]|nr:hypothetical protein [Eubacterium sp.]
MGLFQWIFGKRRKPRNVDELLEAAGEGRSKGLSGPVDTSSFDKIDKRAEAVACCERIMEHMNEMKSQKNEYEVVTGYLNDAEKLENLPPEDHQELEDMAAKVLMFTKRREGLLNQKQRLPQARIDDFEAAADDIPAQIERLKSNEAYQAVVKRDMQYLEGEKQSQIMAMEGARRGQKILYRVMIVTSVLFAIWVIFSLGVTIMTDYDITLISAIIGALMGGSVFAAFLKVNSYHKTVKYSQACLNKAIVMLNRMKAKYVSITNAVDYVYDKYDVHSSYELEYLWEQYQIALREREETERANAQMEEHKRKLLHILRKHDLSGTLIWVNQCLAFIDPREMVEVRHKMVEQRQKIRARMEMQLEEIKVERDNLKF